MAETQTGRLEIAHVLFTDLVGFSLLPMDRQAAYLAEFQQIVRETPQFQAAEARSELIRLPTGDGMALVFFGDPTVAAECAVQIAEALKTRPHLRVRLGIHTGPVYRVADVNTNLNVSGGGINLAQRVMDFGGASEIIVSKTVADVLNQLSHWAPQLHDLGERTAKHGVKIHVYRLGAAGTTSPARPSKLSTLRAGALLAVVTALAAIGWYTLKPKSETPLSAFNYSITVQKFRAGKPFEQPFQLAGEINFERDYRIALEISSPLPGFLYILNEGPIDTAGTLGFNLLFPYSTSGATAQISPGHPVRLPAKGWYQFDDNSGVEKFYMAWSRQPVPELDSLSHDTSSLQDGVVVIRDRDRVQTLGGWLRLHQVPPSGIERHDERRQTTVQASRAILVHLVRLEHH